MMLKRKKIGIAGTIPGTEKTEAEKAESQAENPK
jgi:hypothetical protein